MATTPRYYSVGLQVASRNSDSCSGLVIRDDPAVVGVLIFAAFLALFKYLTPVTPNNWPNS
jgi:hypothetical protein